MLKEGVQLAGLGLFASPLKDAHLTGTFIGDAGRSGSRVFGRHLDWKIAATDQVSTQDAAEAGKQAEVVAAGGQHPLSDFSSVSQIGCRESKYKTLGEWIHVSKELFLRGNHQSYKSAKNCRERWFNHVDPNLSKEWTREDDLTLLESVTKEGKRWALISSFLNHTKNEHMIKNRFYSLLKKAQKGKHSNLDE